MTSVSRIQLAPWHESLDLNWWTAAVETQFVRWLREPGIIDTTASACDSNEEKLQVTVLAGASFSH
jgi:hypothetical protein